MGTLLALFVGSAFAGIGAVVGDGLVDDRGGSRIKARVAGATLLAIVPSLFGLVASLGNAVVVQGWLFAMVGAALGASCGAAALRNKSVGDAALFLVPALGVLVLAPLNLMGAVWLTLI